MKVLIRRNLIFNILVREVWGVCVLCTRDVYYWDIKLLILLLRNGFKDSSHTFTSIPTNSKDERQPSFLTLSDPYYVFSLYHEKGWN